MNPLGIPTPGDWPALARTLRGIAGNRHPNELRGQIASDFAAVTEAWPRRWSTGWQPPRSMRPADLLVMRGAAAGADLGINPADAAHVDRLAAQGVTGAHTLGRIVLNAMPFWIPGRVAWGLARTDPPDDIDDLEMRLPADLVSVWFSEPLRSEHGLAPQWLTDRVVGLADGDRDAWPVDDPWELSHVRALVERPEVGATEVVQICGVVLAAGDEGRPLDVVVWIVAQRWKGGPRDGGWTFTPIPARPQEAGWRALWWSLCAIVAWGDWVPDRPLNVLNRGKMRRFLALGIDPSKLGPVRVLDARHRDTLGADRDGGDGTHASPVTHLRRGHWRRQRHGPGRSEVSLRWIAPTVVNPGNEGSWRETVWTLPPPESIPDTPTPDHPHR